MAWQGFAVRVPTDWDLTGFSGSSPEGYLRIDDGAEQALEVKWVTERAAPSLFGLGAKPKAKPEPVLSERRDTYFKALEDTARRKKLDMTTKPVEVYKPVIRDDRTATGFTWTGDRKAYGAVWYCRTCHRVVIAQVLGDVSGKGGLGSVAEKVLGSLTCHSDTIDYTTWALYDLITVVPSEWTLESHQLMNVYLRLSFTKGAARLSVEQWAVANVARRDDYLDEWIRVNAKAELKSARATPVEATAQGHPAVRFDGGLNFGLPMMEALQQITRFQRPATRFSAVAWDCPVANKIHLVQAFRTPADADPVDDVVERTICHEPTR